MATKTEVEILQAFLKYYGPIEYFGGTNDKRLCFNLKQRYFYSEYKDYFKWYDCSDATEIFEALSIAERFLEREIFKKYNLLISFEGSVEIWLYHKDDPTGEPMYQGIFGTLIEALIAAFQELRGGQDAI